MRRGGSPTGCASQSQRFPDTALAIGPMAGACVRWSTSPCDLRCFMSRQAPAVAAALLALTLLAGCASVARMNQPLVPAQLAAESGGPISTGGYRVIGKPDNQYPSVLVLLAFSGGGK